MIKFKQSHVKELHSLNSCGVSKALKKYLSILQLLYTLQEVELFQYGIYELCAC